jgi:hypothetical protein
MKKLTNIVVLTALLGSAAFGQFDSGQISGFFRDPSQSVIAGAGVTVSNEGNGEKHRIITNASGYYACLPQISSTGGCGRHITPANQMHAPRFAGSNGGAREIQA